MVGTHALCVVEGKIWSHHVSQQTPEIVAQNEYYEHLVTVVVDYEKLHVS